jgi:hypothetical protein
MTYPVFARLCCGLSMTVVFSVGSFSVGQEQLRESEWKRGYHGFNMICAGLELSHSSVNQWRRLPPEETVLVVFGKLTEVPFSVNGYVQRGGAVLVASDQHDSRPLRLRHDIGFAPANAQAILDRDMFQGISDCPIVTDIRIHPCLKNVESIVTNRPGTLTADRLSTIAFLPALRESFHSNAFVAGVENPNGGKLIGVADESVFSNQMIVYGDNAVFAHQTLAWLKGKNRKQMLMLANGKVETAVDPSDVELILPPPTQQEVIDALKTLPPSALLEFGNAVANVVEDENMVNEFINSSVDKVPQVKMNRALIFVAFTIVCVVAVITYAWQKKLMRQSASEVALQGKRRESNGRDSIASFERQMAAGALLDSFCIDLANRRFNDWPSFPRGIISGNDPAGDLMLEAMARASYHYKTKGVGFWTPKR